MSEHILVVDDEPAIRDLMRRILSRAGYEVRTTATAEAALEHLATQPTDIVITDVHLPAMDGLELLRVGRARYPDVDFIVITGYEDMSSAISAMRDGAYDFLVKPLDVEHIRRVVSRCAADRLARADLHAPDPGRATDDDTGTIIGRHPRMVRIYKLIGSIARLRAPVLVRGETGTGKELVARTIHAHSPAADQPFVAVNCTALPETLLESELFGHVRGAFTGAVADRKGRFELAGHGTIFLDEIGDTSPSFQAKLLRVLQENEFFPLGAEQPRRTPARVIAATHRPLEELVRSGAFREDLYFRLRVIEIHVPPLRERASDIPLIAHDLLRRISRKLGKDVSVIPEPVMAALMNYPWPGNVRELENSLTRAVAVARGPAITLDDLALETVAADLGPDAAIGSGTAPDAAGLEPGDETLDAVVAAHVRRVLARTNGNKRETARLLGISPSRLYRLLSRYDIAVP